MSRIDQALRIREGSADTTAATAVESQPEGASPLHQYPGERSADPPDPVPAPALPLPRAVRPQPKPFHNASLEARLVSSTSNAVAVEQYRKLAALLHEEQVQHQLKTVMITSALPGDGKTLTVVNLALTLSESYARRVLVIDADLRMPALHTVLAIPNQRGLSEALRENQELSFVEVSSGLTALTAGDPGPTPLAGLTSNRMREVLEECAARFDWVLIDTSPVGILPDAQVVSRLAGAVILVIGAGTTPAATVQRAVAELGGPESIFGTVLNRVEERRVPESGYYGQYGQNRF